MTPFGAKLRQLRKTKGLRLKDMAADLGLSAAYLSALEHGHRGRPPAALVRRVTGYFNLIWDDAEELDELARLSHPRVVIDTAGLGPEATLLANRLADRVGDLSEETIARMMAEMGLDDKD